MKSKCLALFLALAACASADDLTKAVQTELKNQGFFYTEITGANGPETEKAIKRYQVRNGLEVTGTMNKETLDSLGVQANGAPAPAPKSIPAQPAPNAPIPFERETPPPNTVPPITHLRKDDPVENDRNYLKKNTPPKPNVPPPGDDGTGPRRPNATIGGSEYTKVFSRTPYAAAPLEVQQDTLKRAQKFLANQGFFHDRADGSVGPGTEEAILGYQRLVRLPLTGRLDMETLAAMRMLPGDKGRPPVRREGEPPTKKVYRGVWVN